MKHSLLFGFFLLALSLICSLALGDVSIAVKLSGVIGVIFILLSAIFSGSLVSGDRMRANYATETKEERRVRVNWAIRCACIGLPNVIAAIMITLLLR